MTKGNLIYLKVFIAILGLYSNVVFGQSDNKYQLDLSLGLTKIKEFPDGSSSGLGIDYKMSKLIIGGQLLITQKNILSPYESRNYYNIDLLLGLYKDLKKINLSFCSGLGIASRNEGSQNMPNPNYPKEKTYVTIGLPIRGKIDYNLGKHFAIGLMGYSNINFKQNIVGLNINLGYGF